MNVEHVPMKLFHQSKFKTSSNMQTGDWIKSADLKRSPVCLVLTLLLLFKSLLRTTSLPDDIKILYETLVDPPCNPWHLATLPRQRRWCDASVVDASLFKHRTEDCSGSSEPWRERWTSGSGAQKEGRLEGWPGKWLEDLRSGGGSANTRIWRQHSHYLIIIRRVLTEETSKTRHVARAHW